MEWRQLGNTEPLVENARYNARFSWIRLPLIIVVSGFLWQLSTPAIAFGWSAAMLIVERAATYARNRLSKGTTEFAFLHLLTLAMMSALWVCLGLLLWLSDTELGRIAATIGLLTTALYGALAGQRDIRPGAILTAPPLCTLLALVSWHAWTHWPFWAAMVSSLATLGACASILVCAWILNRSNATLERSNRELKGLARQLADNTALLEETSAMAQVGGWRLDLRTGQLDWTEQTKRIHDVGESFAPTLENALDFYTPESRTKIENAVALATETGAGWNLELQIRSARGQLKCVQANGKATFADGVPVNLLGAFADISQRVRLEAELHQAQKLESIGRLTGGIAHDFNNVLTAILSSAELLENAKDVRTAQVASVIAKAAERAGELTGKLLAFSRQQVLNPVALDLNTSVREAAELLAPTLNSTIALQCELHGAPLHATLDPAQLTNAIINLVLNASDSMPDGGVVRITTRIESPDKVALEITDTGAGMTPDVMEKIFDPFFTTKAAGVGTGLGLSMVHGFVNQSGGEVRVASVAGKGAKFTLIFPCSVAPDTAAAPATEEPTPAPAHGTQVLLVDDDALVREALARALEQRGYVVTSAVDGEAALAAQARQHHDFAIVDVVLTREMSGPNLVRRLMQIDPDLRAILVSGYKQDSEVQTEDGVIDFIAKPFSIDVLIARMQALGLQQHAAPAGVLKAAS